MILSRSDLGMYSSENSGMGSGMLSPFTSTGMLSYCALERGRFRAYVIKVYSFRYMLHGLE